MRFFQNSTQLFTFDATVLRNFVNAQPNASAYRCNPNAPANRNCGEPYAFLNFYAHGGTSFDRIVFDHVTSGGYESDNHTVGRWLQPGGTWVPHGASVSPAGGRCVASLATSTGTLRSGVTWRATWAASVPYWSLTITRATDCSRMRSSCDIW